MVLFEESTRQLFDLSSTAVLTFLSGTNEGKPLTEMVYHKDDLIKNHVKPNDLLVLRVIAEFQVASLILSTSSSDTSSGLKLHKQEKRGSKHLERDGSHGKLPSAKHHIHLHLHSKEKLVANEYVWSYCFDGGEWLLFDAETIAELENLYVLDNALPSSYKLREGPCAGWVLDLNSGELKDKKRKKGLHKRHQPILVKEKRGMFGSKHQKEESSGHELTREESAHLRSLKKKKEKKRKEKFIEQTETNRSSLELVRSEEVEFEKQQQEIEKRSVEEQMRRLEEITEKKDQWKNTLSDSMKKARSRQHQAEVVFNVIPQTQATQQSAIVYNAIPQGSPSTVISTTTYPITNQQPTSTIIQQQAAHNFIQQPSSQFVFAPKSG